MVKQIGAVRSEVKNHRTTLLTLEDEHGQLEEDQLATCLLSVANDGPSKNENSELNGERFTNTDSTMIDHITDGRLEI
ncbi:hypothetical protein LIER_36645 [Lithospermum erythrorhizon]|uniref:Uncharacterized protein n=1 Tax=Lithospermum erythrorhizon TaxID=34254 RepID=A0AAV3P9G2_LITER